MICFNKQLLDEVEHDIMNYQNRGLCYLPKPTQTSVLIIHDIMRKPCSIIVLLNIFHIIRARGADFQVGGLTRTRKREPTRGVRGHAPPGKFEILFF